MAEGEKGILFETARNLASELIKNSGRDERFLLQTNDYGSGKRLLTRDDAIIEINKIKVSPAIQFFSVIFNRQKKQLDKIEGFESYWFSDFQTYAVDIDNFIKDTVNKYFFFPIKHAQSKNIYIDTCYFLKPLVLPGQKAKIKIVVVNTSDEDYEKIPLRLFIDKRQKAAKGIDIGGNKKKEFVLTFTTEKPGWQTGKITVEDYPITFDDELYFAFKVNKHINVLDIYSKNVNKYVKTFYLTDSSYVFDSRYYLKLDIFDFSKYDLIILDALPEISSGLSVTIKSFVENGGNLLLLPDKSEDIHNVNSFLQKINAGKFIQVDTAKTRIATINSEAPIFRKTINELPKNALLPSVKGYYRLRYGLGSGMESLITLLNGNDFLSRKKYGKGLVYLISTPLDEEVTDFMFNPLFVSIMYGVSQPLGKTEKLFYYIDRNDKITVPSVLKSSDDVFKLKLRGSNYEFIPGQQQSGNSTVIIPYGEIKEAGYYDGILNDSVYFTLAFNYNHLESEMKFYNSAQLDSILKQSEIKNYMVSPGEINNLRKVINQEQKGSQIWKLFIIFALLMLLSEVLILRYWK
jgi:hypothetical protein